MEVRRSNQGYTGKSGDHIRDLQEITSGIFMEVKTSHPLKSVKGRKSSQVSSGKSRGQIKESYGS